MSDNATARLGRTILRRIDSGLSDGPRNGRGGAGGAIA